MTSSTPSAENTSAVILAGGSAQRMGGVEKALQDFHGRPMIETIIATLQPKVTQVYINANRDLQRYAAFGLPVVSDSTSEDWSGDGQLHGPLAGLFSTLKQCETDYLLTTPCDTPFVRADYVDRMLQKALEDNARHAVAYSGRLMQPLFCLIHRSALESLNTYLNNGKRQARGWIDSLQPVAVVFGEDDTMFNNCNTLQQLEDYNQAGVTRGDES